MKERAQRARWLKTDPSPDFTIPMMIDYVGDPSHSDDEIRKAYWGGGYYSGAVIDCDGTIRKIHYWAWYGQGGSWMGLKLTPIAELESYLDSYLKNPPACYSTAAPDAGPTTPDSGRTPAGDQGAQTGDQGDQGDQGGQAGDIGTIKRADSGSGGKRADDGCSCSLQRRGSPLPLGALLVLAVLAALLLRRRRRS